MVLHRPVELAAVTGKVGNRTKMVQYRTEAITLTVQETIAAAEKVLPGQPAPAGENDPRWQTIIEISNFVPQEPNAIWPFVLKWGSHEDADLRAAIATCLLEHLLEHHFDLIFQRVETAARSNVWFAKTTAMCGKFGQANDTTRAQRFNRLRSEIRSSPD
jgi:hypothetical protein